MGMTVFFLTLGFITFATYIKYGIEFSNLEKRMEKAMDHQEVDVLIMEVQ